MSLRWMIVLAAEVAFLGIGALDVAAQQARAADATPSQAVTPAANAAPAATGPAAAALSPKQMRDAVAEAMRRANMAKGNDRAAAVKALLDVYRELGRDVLLSAKERLRLGLQMRARLQRFASQFHYETAHGLAGISKVADAQAGAAAGPAVEGLDSMVELIQTTIGRPDDWVAAEVLAQQPGNVPALAGGVGVGFGGAGAARGGGAFGNDGSLEKGAAANGADLVDLIQKTVDPPSWDVNGGVGTIMYFNNLRVLVVRQTAEGQDDVGGVLGGLRNH